MSKAEIVQCSICGGATRSILPWIQACVRCGFRASNLSPGSGRGIEGLEHLRRSNFVELCDRIGEDWKGLSVLEVGCAEGWFLDEAYKRGAHCVAVEPSAEHAAIALASGHEVIVDFFPTNQTSGRSFDIVIFNDVFEHLHNPHSAAAECENLLKPGGNLIINLPNSDGVIYWIAETFRSAGTMGALERMWQKGFPSPHVSYFNRSNLKRLVEKNTTLSERDYFTLPSIALRGMWSRVRSSMPAFVAAPVYFGLLIGWPILRVMPSDISVSVFRKSD